MIKDPRPTTMNILRLLIRLRRWGGPADGNATRSGSVSAEVPPADGRGDPFAAFDEWAGEPDRRAYGDL
jgi:hypothetical protein